MSEGAQPRGWRRTAIALSALFLFDLGVSGQGLLSLAVAAGGLVLMTAGALLSLRKGAWPLARSRGVRAGAYALLGIAAFAAARFHLATAEHHAADVIAACEAYKGRHGVLPATLQQLVPDYLPAVPRAKYTLSYGDFTYSAASDKAHTLVYVSLPPFGRRVYHFEQRYWTHMD